MKLKDIYKKLLKEDESSEGLERLSQKLSEYNTSERNLIYRAESNIVDTWREREIRKDRKPKDTGEFTDAVISELEDHIYTQYPKRSQSKFGVTMEYKSKLDMYADYKYVVFPHKQASIASLDMDSFTAYFRDATQHIKNSSNRFLKEEVDLPDKIESFLDLANEPKMIENLNMSWVGKNWKGLKKVVKEKVNDRTLSGDASYIVAELMMFMRNMDKYFDELQKGVKPYSAEVIFDGPSYLLINENVFDDHFVWSGSEWSINI